MSQISQNDMESALSGDPDELNVHLSLVERDVVISGKAIRIHCHCMSVDGNGRVSPQRLAEFMRNAIVDYAIPKSRVTEARERDAKFRSGSAMSGLHSEARKLFTDISNTGEGGELLLYLLAERFLKIPQVLCKMDLKTSSSMHYHGADGVYASVSDDGMLKLFWGESKVYSDFNGALRSCFDSLSPFLSEPEGEDSARERDLVLLSDKADLGDPKLSAALKRYFDRNLPLSLRVKYCGVAFVGFDADFYPNDGLCAVGSEIEDKARLVLSSWTDRIGCRLSKASLDDFEIDLLCFPLPSAEGFRKAFLKAMGLANG